MAKNFGRGGRGVRERGEQGGTHVSSGGRRIPCSADLRQGFRKRAWVGQAEVECGGRLGNLVRGEAGRPVGEVVPQPGHLGRGGRRVADREAQIAQSLGRRR